MRTLKAEKFYYRTIVKVAIIQGYTAKDLAKICGVTPDTITRRHRRSGRSDLTSQDCYLLQQALAPHLTLDELFPEPYIEAKRKNALRDTSL